MSKIESWIKNIASCNELRKWYNHDSNKHVKDIRKNKKLIEYVLNLHKKYNVVRLIHSSKEPKNNA